MYNHEYCNATRIFSPNKCDTHHGWKISCALGNFTTVRHMSFSTSSMIDETSAHLKSPHIPTSLDILPLISPSTLDSISMLPEIQSLFSSSSNLTNNRAIELIQRAKDVFSSIPTSQTPPNENPLIAVLLLLAHFQSNAFQCQDASSTIRSIRSILSLYNEENKFEIKKHDTVNLDMGLIYAQAKVEWNAGNFKESERLAMELKHILDSLSQNKSNPTMKYFQHLNMLGLSKLCMFAHDFVVEGDTDSLAESNLQSMLKSLEQIIDMTKEIDLESLSGLNFVRAQAYTNYGIAQMIAYLASLQIDENNLLTESIPTILDARESWTNAMAIAESILDIVSKETDDETYEMMLIKSKAKLIKANLECIIAQSILFPTGVDINPPKELNPDELKVASKLSRKALLAYDELIASVATSEKEANTISIEQLQVLFPLEPLMARALSLVAICYVHADSAVTAQGLFQSSLDVYEPSSSTQSNSDHKKTLEKLNLLSPFTQMYHRDTLERYATLCQNWEKRENEAVSYLKKKDLMKKDQMSDGWRYQPGIMGGLFFF